MNYKYLVPNKNKYLVTLLFILISLNSFCQNYNYDQGIEFFKTQDYNKAIDCFNKAIDQEPKQGIYYYFRATCYKNLDEKNWALRDINTAINCFSKKEKISCAGAYNFRGDLYRGFEEYEKALADYTNAIKLDPTELDYYFNRASIYLILKLFEKAKIEYQKILSIDESSLRAYSGLSRVCLETDKNQEALLYANKVIKMDASYSLGYLYRGNYFIKINEFEQAIDDYISYFILSDYNEFGEILIKKFGRKNSTYTLTKISSKISTVQSPNQLMLLRASLNEEMGNYSEAIYDYYKLLETCDEYDKSYYHFLIGVCFFRMDNHKSLLQEMNLASEIDSTFATFYGYKGIAYNSLKDYRLADENYDIAIKMSGEETWFYTYRAECKINQADYKNALKDLDYAIALDKNYFYSYYSRALLYKNQFKDIVSANKDFKFIVDHDTNFVSSSNKKQFAYYFLNEKEKAIEWQDKILNEDPIMIDFYEASKFYALLNEKTKSIEYLSTAIKKGFRMVSLLEKDQEFNSIKNLEDFKVIIKDLKDLNFKESQAINIVLRSAVVDTTTKVTIPMKSKGSGTFEVQCSINKLKLNMIFDTGASVISISQTEVDFMLKNGYLTENDIVGSSSYMDANGDIEIGTTIILREVDFGGLILKNVKASVVNSKNAPLLFGQSALSKYGKITIDNAKKTLTISK